MRKILLACFLILSLQSYAQRYRHSPVIQKGLYFSFNPHSILEPEQGAIGLGIGYRISKKFELWTEANYLYKGFFMDPEQFGKLKGIRSITSFKYYYNNRHGFFVGAEFRIKHYSFNDKNDFANVQLGDTLRNFQYRPVHTLIGGGVFWGKRFKLTANGKFEMEGNIGIGIKQRSIERTGLPAGYTQLLNYPKDRVGPIPDHNEEVELLYFPAIMRFIYHL